LQEIDNYTDITLQILFLTPIIRDIRFKIGTKGVFKTSYERRL